jgi:hypothetical protein
VGKNILDGLESFKLRDPALASLPIIEIDSATKIAGPGIYHCKIGRNRDIPSKFHSFEDILIRRGLGAEVDLALMKLCYVDIGESTVVSSVFKEYTSLAERVMSTHPRLNLLHATVPLTIHGKGFRRALRNLVKGDQKNMKRCEFNDLIRKHFPARSIVDLARFESTREDGSRVTFARFGREYEAANEQWMDGAGHLNKLGGERLARLFLQAIVQTITGRVLISLNTSSLRPIIHCPDSSISRQSG